MPIRGVEDDAVGRSVAGGTAQRRSQEFGAGETTKTSARASLNGSDRIDGDDEHVQLASSFARTPIGLLGLRLIYQRVDELAALADGSLALEQRLALEERVARERVDGNQTSSGREGARRTVDLGDSG